VIAPPPLLLLAALVGGYGGDCFAPVANIGDAAQGPRAVAAGVFALVALGLALAGSQQFRRAGTPVQPWRASTQLVTTGVFAHVRNPMYAGMILLALAAAIWTGGAWMSVAVIGLFLTLHFGVVLREERYLAARFGEDYRAYMARTPRYGWKF